MKPNMLAALAVFLFLTGCSATSSSAKKEEQAARYEQTAALIEGGSYQYTVRSASPAGGRSIQITSTYTFDVKDGIYKAYLPYYGRAHSASYGGNGGVEFEGEPANLSLTRDDKKQNVTVKFQIKNKDETYDCLFVVTASGNATLTVTSSKRQVITYYGAVAGIRE
jgi:hypothetical protein